MSLFLFILVFFFGYLAGAHRARADMRKALLFLQQTGQMLHERTRQ